MFIKLVLRTFIHLPSPTRRIRTPFEVDDIANLCPIQPFCGCNSCKSNYRFIKCHAFFTRASSVLSIKRKLVSSPRQTVRMWKNHNTKIWRPGIHGRYLFLFLLWLALSNDYEKSKSSRPDVLFCEKGVLRNFAKFTGNTCARVSF